MSELSAQIPNTGFDVERVRRDFPILSRKVHGKPLVYLDTAASAQRPLAVIEAIDDFYRRHNANIHRGVHSLSLEATEAYEGARKRVAAFINAPSENELVFTRGTTESINLVAQAFARPMIKPGDEILISHMEHHSNIVPWQLLCEQTGAELKVIPINARGELEMDAFHSMLSERVKMMGIVHISNALGTVNPIPEICTAAHRYEIPVLVDGAQAMPHRPVDVRALGCDFYCFSGHKMYGPTGIGGLWAPMATLEAMQPYQGGGEMIKTVSFEGTEYNDPPGKFEAGHRTSPAASDWVPRSITWIAWAWRTSRPTKQNYWLMPLKSFLPSTDSGLSARPPTRQVLSHLCWATFTRMTLAPSSIITALRSGPATTAPCLRSNFSACPPLRVFLWGSTTPAMK